MAAPTARDESPPDVLLVGTGEYTTGFVHDRRADSDKGAGVVALTIFDLRARAGKVASVRMAGVNGDKFPKIRKHLIDHVGLAYPKSFPDPDKDLAFASYPADDARDPLAYERAVADSPPGSAAVIFTPDDTHFAIARACLRRGLHVLITKPATKTLAEHAELQALAARRGLLCCVEVHKRLDPMYADARDRIRALGPVSFFHAYMSQPKHQLDTFRRWAGSSSDISYYLNSHHVDFHDWCAGAAARPVRVVARRSDGLASNRADFPAGAEDTVTLVVDWVNAEDGSMSHATYTASWAAPRSDAHSQQRFFCLARRGEVAVDQAHRGYTKADDLAGFGQCNPLFMKYAPTDGRFAGQEGYGYRAFEVFIDAVRDVRAGRRDASAFDTEGRLATLATTARATAVLEAGRRSLDTGGGAVHIVYEDPARPEQPTALRVEGATGP